MLTPMMVQYLVALCCWRHDPNAVEIILGDRVFDSASEGERDVDVTVTIKNTDGSIEAFKAAEVKAEGRPLDVSKVEQLCQKFEDMPKITHKSIFSCSGYTEGAIKKAKAHSVDLYTMMPCDKPIGKATEIMSSYTQALLYWVNYRPHIVVPDASSPILFCLNTPILTKSGLAHKKYTTIQELIDDILYRSTAFLCSQEPAVTILMTFPFGSTLDCLEGPLWPHTHTLDTTRDNVYLKSNDTLHRIDSITINGNLQWKKQTCAPEFYVLKNAVDQTVFAGATISEYGTKDGHMFVMTYTEKGLELGIHPNVYLSEKHQKIISQLKIK